MGPAETQGRCKGPEGARRSQGDSHCGPENTFVKLPVPRPSCRAGREASAHTGLGCPGATRTFFRSLTWPVMTATTYILSTRSVLQSRKAGSAWPLTSAKPAAGISAGALGDERACRASESREEAGRARGGLSALGTSHSRRVGKAEGREVLPAPPLARTTPPWQILQPFLISSSVKWECTATPDFWGRNKAGHLAGPPPGADVADLCPPP